MYPLVPTSLWRSANSCEYQRPPENLHPCMTDQARSRSQLVQERGGVIKRHKPSALATAAAVVAPPLSL